MTWIVPSSSVIASAQWDDPVLARDIANLSLSAISDSMGEQFPLGTLNDGVVVEL